MNMPKIQNALQNVRTACQKKMEELYPKGVPNDIKSRVAKELLFLEHSEYIDDFELFRRLSEETKKCSTCITTRGTLAGSILYYLLSNNGFNPLSPHYYCTECGYYEVVDTNLFGIDLPTKKCPHCDHDIQADGFNLSIESVWGSDGQKLITFEYNVNSEFLPFARNVIQSAYPNTKIIPWGIFKIDPLSPITHVDTRTVGVNLTGYAILPINTSIEDYPDLISYLENGDACITGSAWELTQNMLKTIKLYSLDSLDELLKLQRETGIYVNDLGIKELRDITWSQIYNTGILNRNTRVLFHEFRPKTFKDLVALDVNSHNSFSWASSSDSLFDISKFKEMVLSESFKKHPCFTREDFFDQMIKMGIDRGLAFEASEKIRKGHVNSGNNKYKQEFMDLAIPESIKEVAQNYLYVFPRAHEIEYLLLYAKFAYYAKLDSRAFTKIVFKNNK